MTEPRSSAAPPSLTLAPGQSGYDIEIVRRALAIGGAMFFPGHRWFGDKARSITSVELVDLAFAVPVVGVPERIAISIVEIAFTDGGTERYFMPLVLLDAGEPSPSTLAVLTSADGRATSLLDDGLETPAFHAWLLNPIATDSVVAVRSGGLTWRPGPEFDTRIQEAETSESHVSGAEQSNSAVIYGRDILVKLFRKLRPGLNPDIELSRFLTEETAFRNFPALLGDLAYETGDGQSYALGMTLPFIPNLGDGWYYIQERLADMLAGTAVDLDLVAPLRRLGRRTGELHRALATPTLDPAFAPEPITAADIHGWITSLTAASDRTFAALRDRARDLPPDWRARLGNLSASSSILADRIAGFNQLRESSKTRVHGDFHLGQTLVTPDEDFVILDFEGEPSREMEERRAKTSPLKDVAGMLRSLSYARAAALRALPADLPRPAAEEHLAAWERDARDAFLIGYREETADQGASFLPADPQAFAAALAAWELDKAIYEINYELNNRPDWLPLPLGALLGD